MQALRGRAGGHRSRSGAERVVISLRCAVVRGRYRLAAIGLSLAASFGTLEAGAEAPPLHETGARGAESDPCLQPEQGRLRCPDLQMRRPFDLVAEHTPGGHVLLHSSSAIKSRGKGPIELHGKRIGPREMRVTQRIYRVGKRPLDVRTAGRLHFTFIPGQGGYWKFTDAASFDLWSVDRKGRRKRLVRTGPKTHYCFRDLVRTGPSRRSPHARVYPGCNQDPNKHRVTLGTSVGWSDVYPAEYYEQWIDVTGLRGCFAYVLVADPKNHIYESHENNNEAQRIVRLPPERGPGRCP
jgi:Lysyl oxidase